MDKGLYVAMAGARETMLAQSVHSNNLANASTLGFKAFYNDAVTHSIKAEHGHDTRSYAMSANLSTDFSEGVLKQTGNDLDVAIKGQGFLVVQTPQLQQQLTRNGAMQLTPEGLLVDPAGNPIIGDGGPILIPPYERLTIGIDGTITIQPAGANVNETAVVAQLMLVKPPTQQITREPNGYFVAPGGLPPADPTVEVIGGMLEGSNVNVVREFTKILSLGRQYELQVKMMKESHDQSEKAARLLQLS